MLSPTLARKFYDCRIDDPPIYPRRSSSLQSIQHQVCFGDMKFRDRYGPPRDEDGTPFGLLFYIFKDDDVTPIRERNETVSVNAVFRLLYKRVGRFNTDLKRKDFICLLHPLFLDTFEQTGSYNAAINAYGCFVGRGVERYMIPIFRYEHFFLVEAGVVNGKAIFVVADSMGSGFRMFHEETARKLSARLFPDFEYGKTLYPDYVIKKQDRNDCAIHTIMNCDICLQSKKFMGDCVVFFIKRNNPLNVGALRDSYAAELEAMLLEQTNAEKELNLVKLPTPTKRYTRALVQAPEKIYRPPVKTETVEKIEKIEKIEKNEKTEKPERPLKPGPTVGKTHVRLPEWHTNREPRKAVEKNSKRLVIPNMPNSAPLIYKTTYTAPEWVFDGSPTDKGVRFHPRYI